MSRSFPGPLQRLSDDVRSACRAAVSGSSAGTPSAHAPSHRVALGEWLGAVRQPRGEFAPLALVSPRARRAQLAALETETSRGDLSRTHIMRLKGDRAHLEDGLDRSRRYSR